MKIFGKSLEILLRIAQLTDHPQIIKYLMEKYCSENFKKYKTISAGGLWAEQFTIKNKKFYRENL